MMNSTMAATNNDRLAQEVAKEEEEERGGDQEGEVGHVRGRLLAVGKEDQTREGEHQHEEDSRA